MQHVVRPGGEGQPSRPSRTLRLLDDQEVDGVPASVPVGHPDVVPTTVSTAVLACLEDPAFLADEDWRVLFLNDAAVRITGVAPREAIGRPIASLVGALVDACALEDARDSLARGDRWTGDARIQGPGGVVSIARLRLAAAIADGRPAVVGVLRDISSLEGAEAAARLADARLRAFLDRSPLVAFAKDAQGRYVWANAEFIRANGDLPRSAWEGRTDEDLWPERAAAYREADQTVLAAGEPITIAEEGGSDPLGRWWLTTKFPLIDSDGRTGIGGISLDVTDRKQLDDRLTTLAAAIEQSTESIVVTDQSGTIEYVNPAFERTSGYSEDELIGANPRVLKSGVQPPAFYAAMWRTLASGRAWVGDLVNRNRDGSLYHETASITPVRDASGQVVHYVGVKRNVSRERQLEAMLERQAREHGHILAAIESISRQGTPDETARAVCQAIASLPGLALATIIVFEHDGTAAPLAVATSDGMDTVAGRVPLARSVHLRERAVQGPWVGSWTPNPDHPYQPVVERLGISSLAYAPLQHDGVVFGLMAAGGTPGSSLESLTARLPAIDEYARMTAALIGAGIATRLDRSGLFAEVRSVLDRRRFRPVFQPIVNLASGAVVGFEALTRFEDGRAPDKRFAEAETVGLGEELELATLEAAFDAAGSLPATAWLDLNVSPRLVTAHDGIASLLHRWGWNSVIEVTEHSEVGDYGAFRDAVASLGPGVQLAVDDAGAGYASFRHILELHPAYIKLDRSLVAGIDEDPGRLALVVGISFFASGIGADLIAEGIETKGELETLRGLGVQLGQGYFLARPDDATKVPTVQVW